MRSIELTSSLLEEITCICTPEAKQNNEAGCKGSDSSLERNHSIRPAGWGIKLIILLSNPAHQLPRTHQAKHHGLWKLHAGQGARISRHCSWKGCHRQHDSMHGEVEACGAAICWAGCSSGCLGGWRSVT